MHHIVARRLVAGRASRASWRRSTRLHRGPAVAAARAAGAVRRLRRLAAPVARRRDAERAARLLARAARWRCRRCWSCPGPAAPGRSDYRGASVRSRCRRRSPRRLTALGQRAGRDAVHDAAGRPSRRSWPLHAARTTSRVGTPDRQPQPRRDRGADRLLRQHPGAARATWRRRPASASCSRGCARRRSAPTRTRTCRSRSWCRSCSPSAPRPQPAVPGDVPTASRAAARPRRRPVRPAPYRRTAAAPSSTCASTFGASTARCGVGSSTRPTSSTQAAPGA